MKPDSTGAATYTCPLYFGNGDSNVQDGWFLRHYTGSTKKLYFHMGDSATKNLGGIYISNSAITDNVWSYIAVTVDRDVGYQGYLNTIALNSYSTNTAAYSIGEVSAVYAGRDWSATDYFYKGNIDEVRISKALRTPGWMTTSYNNIMSTSTFYSIGAESQIGYNTPGTLYSSIFDLGSTDKEIKSITVEQNIPSGCTLQVTAEVSNDATFSAANVVSQVYSDTSTSYYTSSTEATLNGKRYLRYKVDMTACNGNTETPTLYGAKFNYR
jgi:hypothetical protein